MQSKKKVNNTNPSMLQPAMIKIKQKGVIVEYRLTSNGLTVLFVRKPNTGVITSDIVYKVGARDEVHGVTGIAHMLEHMLFKPTKHDIRRKSDSGAMQFEREMGVILNANTWKDRTSYFFSYPKEHFETALRIEAERMHDVVLTDTEFIPERTNVLSEYDMYSGNEEFALSVPMIATAFHSHPYGHETIGFREDIESYTIEKLKIFYETYYAPNNATLIIVGDVSENDMRTCVEKYFGNLKPSLRLTTRPIIREPKQEGLRMVHIRRPSTKNILAIGVKHDGFPKTGWFETMIALHILAGGEDSILNKKLVDTSLVTSVSSSIEPTYDTNLAMLYITLSQSMSHEDIYTHIRKIVDTLTQKDITPYLKKIIAQNIMSELTTREHSLGFASELVEYVSASAWEHFFETEEKLRTISARDVLSRIKILFNEDLLTIGHFIGTK